jgi:hypothetical protein
MESVEGFEAAQYALRASFYYRANARWDELTSLLDSDFEPDSWTPDALGISQRAVNRVAELGLTFSRVFAHPDVLIRMPRLIAYCRGLALLPQKGVQRLAFGTTTLEQGRGTLSEERASQLSKTLNSLVSLQIESEPEWTLQRAHVAALLNLGSQINGSWRNVIGEEGNRQIKVLLSSLLTDDGLVDQYVHLSGQLLAPPVRPEDAVNLREIKLTNGYTVRFGSEPDVATKSPADILTGTIEVKFGSDPAGALERYGAAKKSFEAAVKQNSRVQNVYVANVITDEVRRRINDDRLVSAVFEFSQLIVDQAERQRLHRFVTRQMLDI